MTEPKHTILCVDDEANILHSLKRLLRKEDFRLLIAESGIEGLSLLAENRVNLVISDQRMPDMSGTEFLAKVKDGFPDVIRIILTGYTDVDSITGAINKGHIYKFFLKPWNDQNLRLEIRQALKQYDLIQANKQLHQKILEQNDALKTLNRDLEKKVQERTSELEIQNQALELSHTILEDLPIPIIGVSAEGLIVIINQATQALEQNGKQIEIGRKISNFFPETVEDRITHVLASNTAAQIDNCLLLNQTCDLSIIPLSGRFSGKGAMVLIQCRQLG